MELLVVISLIALLMAVLLPSLQQARKQAKAVACQANLRQWGIVFSGKFAEGEPITGDPVQAGPYGAGWVIAERLTQNYGSMTRKLLLCPVASQAEEERACEMDVGGRCAVGSTFTAWWFSPRDRTSHTGSYYLNFDTGTGYLSTADRGKSNSWDTTKWADADRSTAWASIPVMFDSAHGRGDSWLEGPPPYADPIPRLSTWQDVCINRHNGGVNYLFLDWSVRKVGLKELWTLKWTKGFDTKGPWTKAGGVQPEDWPAWMRKFRDY